MRTITFKTKKEFQNWLDNPSNDIKKEVMIKIGEELWGTIGPRHLKLVRVRKGIIQVNTKNKEK
jgi:hypothetical protein